VSVVTVVLAAGRGERLGGPKALLAWPWRGGELPLAIAHAEARLAMESARVLLVTRAAVKNTLLTYAREGVEFVVSDEADALGPAGSLRAAMPYLGEARAVVITPVDAPPARAETVSQLLTRLEAEHGIAGVRPSYAGRSGHPVVMRPEALSRYLEPNPPPLRDHLRALGERVVFEVVGDESVLWDLDTRDDVSKILGKEPRFLVG